MTEEISSGWYPAEYVPAPIRKKGGGRRRSSDRSTTVEDYFGVAMEILAGPGPESLTTAALCDRLRITKGSFYYHFRGMDHFVELFVAHRETVLNNLFLALAAQPDPRVRILSGIKAWAAMPHDAEISIRAWSRSNPVVAASQERIDRSVLSLSAATLAPLVENQELVELTARQLSALMIGLQQLERPVDPDGLIHSVLAFLERACGLDLGCFDEAAGA